MFEKEGRSFPFPKLSSFLLLASGERSVLRRATPLLLSREELLLFRDPEANFLSGFSLFHLLIIFAISRSKVGGYQLLIGRRRRRERTRKHLLSNLLVGGSPREPTAPCPVNAKASVDVVQMPFCVLPLEQKEIASHVRKEEDALPLYNLVRIFSCFIPRDLRGVPFTLLSVSMVHSKEKENVAKVDSFVFRCFPGHHTKKLFFHRAFLGKTSKHGST